MAVEKNDVDQKRSVGCNATNNDARTTCRTHQFSQRTGYKCMYLPFDMKKLASITTEGNGLSMVVSNPKRNGDFALLLERRQNQIRILARQNRILDLGHGLSRLEDLRVRILMSGKCVARTNEKLR